jgi:hypothetical protein
MADRLADAALSQIEVRMRRAQDGETAPARAGIGQR